MFLRVLDKPYINDDSTVIAGPHKIFGSQTNDVVLQFWFSCRESNPPLYQAIWLLSCRFVPSRSSSVPLVTSLLSQRVCHRTGSSPRSGKCGQNVAKGWPRRLKTVIAPTLNGLPSNDRAHKLWR